MTVNDGTMTTCDDCGAPVPVADILDCEDDCGRRVCRKCAVECIGCGKTLCGECVVDIEWCFPCS